MQLLIDTDTDPTGLLRNTAAILLMHADARDSGQAPAIMSSPVVELTPETPAASPLPSEVFGKDPLPAAAIAVDVPASFTAPAVFTAPTATPETSAQGSTSATALPTATPATAAAALTAVLPLVDKNGHPWDERIHSETKKRNADNTWRLRRNLDPAVRDAVLCELDGIRAPMTAVQVVPVLLPSVPAGTSAPSSALAQFPQQAPPPPPEPATVAPEAPTVPPASISAGVPPAPAVVLPVTVSAPDAPPAPIPAGAQGNVSTISPSNAMPISTFKDLMAHKVTPAIQAGKLTAPRFAELCVACGVAGPGALVQTPAKIPEVAAAIDREVAAKAA